MHDISEAAAKAGTLSSLVVVFIISDICIVSLISTIYYGIEFAAWLAR